MIEKPVMTCKEDIDSFLRLSGGAENILWSPKLDGVRLWAVIDAPDSETVTYLSRTKKPYLNFGCFDKGLLEYARQRSWSRLHYPIIFDGEIVSKDFSGVMAQLRRQTNVDSSVFEFRIFDIIDNYDSLPFVARCEVLRKVIGGNKIHNIVRLPHWPYPAEIATKDGIIKLMNRMRNIGYEGIVLKTKDGLYENKKSGLWLKVKPAHTKEVRVIGLEMGSGKHAGRMGALICEYSGGSVNVGGGFSDEERERFMEDLPSVIEVEYQEETKGSLRFPRFKRVRNDKPIEEI